MKSSPWRRVSVLSIDPAAYAPHALHDPTRSWSQTNCYADLWLEVLHAFRLDPLACMGFTLALDFEGDQFTFFKPPHSDLQRLYGIEIEELTIYRPLWEHAYGQVALGKLVLAEVDSYYLPDTAGTDYKTAHSKTTIGIETIDPDAKALGYFHNAGYYHLSGADYEGLFRLGERGGEDSVYLPPYVEFVRLRGLERLPDAELHARSVALGRGHFMRRPVTNPIARFRPQFDEEIAILAGNVAAYHAYAFASLRQLGAGMDLAAAYLRWLGAHGESGLGAAAEHLDAIGQVAKTLILKAARAVNGRRPLDTGPMMGQMESSWDAAMKDLAVWANC